MNLTNPAIRKKPAILDRPLNKLKDAHVSLSSLSFLFSEMLQYSQKNVLGIEELEKRLSSLGYRVDYVLPQVRYKYLNYR